MMVKGRIKGGYLINLATSQILSNMKRSAPLNETKCKDHTWAVCYK